MNVRATARTNGVRSAAVTDPWDISAGRQIHPRAERRRKAASEAPVQLERPRSRRLGHRSCAVNFQTVCGLLGWLPGGSRKRPFANAFRTLPRGQRTEIKWLALRRIKTGNDFARLRPAQIHLWREPGKPGARWPN